MAMKISLSRMVFAMGWWFTQWAGMVFAMGWDDFEETS